MSLSAAMSTATKPVDGRPFGAAIVVVSLFVSASGRVAPVALSKTIHEARYATEPWATPAATAAFSNVSPFASRRGATIGFTCVR